MPRETISDSLVNPAKTFYAWSGDEDNGGVFKHYDKEKKENILTKIGEKTPFTFLVIGTCSTIKGFSESEGSGIWANEVKDTKSQPFTVRAKSGIIAQGLYENIKDGVVAKGGKFSQSVYAAMKDASGNLQIVNIQFYGAALGPWIDFCKKTKLHEVAVQVKDVLKSKKGKNTYFTPIFNEIKVSAKTDDEAGALQKELNEYLNAYFAKKTDVATTSQTTEPERKEDPKKSSEQPKSGGKSREAESNQDIHSSYDPNADDETLPF